MNSTLDVPPQMLAIELCLWACGSELDPVSCTKDTQSSSQIRSTTSNQRSLGNPYILPRDLQGKRSTPNNFLAAEKNCLWKAHMEKKLFLSTRPTSSYKWGWSAVGIPVLKWCCNKTLQGYSSSSTISWMGTEMNTKHCTQI